VSDLAMFCSSFLVFSANSSHDSKEGEIRLEHVFKLGQRQAGDQAVLEIAITPKICVISTSADIADPLMSAF